MCQCVKRRPQLLRHISLEDNKHIARDFICTADYFCVSIFQTLDVSSKCAFKNLSQNIYQLIDLIFCETFFALNAQNCIFETLFLTFSFPNF